MKTIRLSYRVRNYLYPFRVVLMTYDLQHLNPKQADYEFSEIYKTLILSSD